MKRTLLAGLSLLSINLLASACATEEDPETSLPGDIDDAPPAGGKGDAWDGDNDPHNLANRLTYKLSSLPRTGKLDKPVWKNRYTPTATDVPLWSDTYWPTAEGSINARWLGRTVKSPVEKYDAAFNNAAGCEQPASRCGTTAKAAWDTYIACAGPAAKWHAATFQGSRDMYDGVDSDGDGSKDECGDHDGIAGWWGLCHAWSPAAILEPEPQHAVTYNGQTFEVADIKALIVGLYDDSESLFLGGRCNAEKFERGPNGELDNIDAECMDVNPGALHVILSNFLGLKDAALVMDRTAPSEVWNQPIYGYNVTKQTKVTGKRANTCIGDAGDTYKRNSSAKELYEVEIDVEYLVEGSASKTPLGMEDYLSTDSYHYILEVGSTGKVIGGTYCTDSIDNHPDFLWAPTGVSSTANGRNPNLSLASVRKLIELSRAPVGGTTVGDKTFAATGNVAIPDNNTTGAKLDVPVTSSFTARSLAVEVDVVHTYRGDLIVSLLRNGTVVKVLANNTGGSAQDIHETFNLTAAELGTTDPKATWSLKVVDNAEQDTGSIHGVKLVFGS